MTDDDLQRAWRAWCADRTCWHEAGHALVATLVGHVVDLVSTRPGEAYGGVTLFVHDQDHPDMAAVTSAVLPLQPERGRAWIERRILIDLAGEVAASFAPPWTGAAGYIGGDDDDETRAREQAEALNRQSPRHRELLAENEADTESTRDEDRARAIGAYYLEPDGIGHHIEWMRAESRHLLTTHRAQLIALHDALAKRHVMTAYEIDVATAGTTCWCHGRWYVTTPKDAETGAA